jgi:hypothetical protein
MFCPLKGTGVYPWRFSTRQRAALIRDLPAPLLVPSTMRGGGALTGREGARARLLTLCPPLPLFWLDPVTIHFNSDLHKPADGR